MSADPYSPLVRRYFAGAAHSGDLNDAETVDIDEQGVQIRLAATYADGKILALAFRAWGCPHVIAACEGFCAEFEGKPLVSLGGFRAADIMQKLSVPVEKTGRILVLEDAVRSLGQRIGDGRVPR
jgi:NifU-like protein involved in Fe-S cluster formation